MRGRKKVGQRIWNEMKHKIIKAKVTIVLIDILDHHVANVTHIAPGLDTLTVQDVRTGDYVFGVNGMYRPLGELSRLSEEDWKGIVDYNTYYSTLTKSWEGSATEFGLSLLKANGVVMENPMGEEPLRYTPDIGSDFVPYHDKWKEAQEQVWSPNTHVFIKID